MGARGPAGADGSEATPEVARRLARSFDPWPEAVELDARRPVEAMVADALIAVDGLDLRGLHGVAAAIDRGDELAGSLGAG